MCRERSRNALVDPGITLDRFGWDTDEAESMTLTQPDDTEILWEDPEVEEEP